MKRVVNFFKDIALLVSLIRESITLIRYKAEQDAMLKKTEGITP